MALLTLTDKDKFLINQEGQDFSHEAKTFIKIRESALDKLGNLEFPTPKLEDWKYTNVREIAKGEFRPQSAININKEDIQSHLIPGLDAFVLVFVNGFFVPQFSTIEDEGNDGIIVMNLNEAKSKHIKLVEPHLGVSSRTKEHFFVNLNNAYSQDGAFVYVNAKAEIEKPVHIINLVKGDNVCSMPRNLVVAEKLSSVKVVMTYETINSDVALTNTINEFVVAEGANVYIDKIQNENEASFHIGADYAVQEKSSVFTINTIPANGKLVRNNLNIKLNGEGCTANLNGAICLNGNIHVDNQTFVEHAKPHCDSNELYKAVVNDTASNIFNGKIHVFKDAQKTNAFQSNANILMTDEAKVNAKPQLEIYADDVKCSHGCTIGQFDDEALFYLRARGIKESTARKVLLDAFIGEALDNIEIEAVRSYVDRLITANFDSKL